jgi:hypothetical protein
MNIWFYLPKNNLELTFFSIKFNENNQEKQIYAVQHTVVHLDGEEKKL